MRDAEGAKENGRPFDIVSVASVSGGSVTNGVVACETRRRGSDLSRVALHDFRVMCRPLLETVTTKGLIPARGRTWGYFVALLAAAAVLVLSLVVAVTIVATAGRGEPGWGVLVLIYGGIVVVGLIAIVLRTRRRARRDRRAGLRAMLVGAALLIVMVTAVLTHRLAGDAHGTVAWASAIGAVTLVAVAAALVIWMAARRGEVLRRALNRFHYTNQKLIDLRGGATRHVFCATELQSGHQCFLSPDLVIEWNAGEASPGTLEVATAVQASAALPGGFPPSAVDLERAGIRLARPWRPDGEPVLPLRRLLLADGGVYDNMGDEWEFGYPDRAQRSDILDGGDEANLLVVANAGKNLGWKPFVANGRVTRELAALMRDQSIEYDATTTQRRRSLLARFRAAERSGQGLVGVIAHVPTTPLEVCEALQRSDDPGRVRRADECRKRLVEAAEPWTTIATSNGEVKTTLSAIGVDRTVELVLHAATLVTVSCYVVHDLGDGSLPTRADIDVWVRSASAPDSPQ